MDNDLYRDFTYINDIVEGIERLLSRLPIYASIELLQDAVRLKPETLVQDGLKKFFDWYVDYYKVK